LLKQADIVFKEREDSLTFNYSQELVQVHLINILVFIDKAYDALYFHQLKLIEGSVKTKEGTSSFNPA